MGILKMAWRNLWRHWRRTVVTVAAMTLAFLGSDASRYVNGVNLNVDMGFNAFMTTGQIDFSGLA